VAVVVVVMVPAVSTLGEPVAVPVFIPLEPVEPVAQALEQVPEVLELMDRATVPEAGAVELLTVVAVMEELEELVLQGSF
jgi:hypothetical protein